MPGKRVDQKIIKSVYFSYKEGKTAKELAEQYQLALRTVYNIINRAEHEGRLELLRSSGRPRKLSRRDELRILKKVRQNPKKGTRCIALEIKNEYGAEVSHETVRQIIIRNKKMPNNVKEKAKSVKNTRNKKQLSFALRQESRRSARISIKQNPNELINDMIAEHIVIKVDPPSPVNAVFNEET